MRCYTCRAENPDSATVCYNCQTTLSNSGAVENMTLNTVTNVMSNDDLQSLIRESYSIMSSKRQEFNRLLNIEAELRPLEDTSIRSVQFTEIDPEEDSAAKMVAAAAYDRYVRPWIRFLRKCYTVIAYISGFFFITGLLECIVKIISGDISVNGLVTCIFFGLILLPFVLSKRKLKKKLKKLRSEKQQVLNELWHFYDQHASKAIPFEYSYPDTLKELLNISITNYFTTLKDTINEFERQKQFGLLAQQNAAVHDSITSMGLILTAYVVEATTPDIVIKKG